MHYDESKRVLLTMSKDKKVTFWKFPHDWINEDLKKFEQDEIRNINDTLAYQNIMVITMMIVIQVMIH